MALDREFERLNLDDVDATKEYIRVLFLEKRSDKVTKNEFIKISSCKPAIVDYVLGYLTTVDNWKVVQKLYGSNSISLANNILKLVTRSSDSGKWLKTIGDVGLETLKSSTDEAAIQQAMSLWYLIYKEGMEVSSGDFERSAVILMRFVVGKQETVQMYKATLMEIKKRNVAVLFDELENYLILDNETLLLKNYRVFIQLFTADSVEFFCRVEFQAYLAKKVGLLVERFQKTGKVDEDSVLDLLSIFESLAVDEKCVDIIIETHLGLLVELIYSADNEIAVLSAVTITKCWNRFQAIKLSQDKSKIREAVALDEIDLKLEDLFEVFVKGMNQSSEVTCLTHSAEGLAYLSLKVQFKSAIRSNTKLVTKLVSVLKDELQKEQINGELIYGIMLIITNISTFNPKLTTDEKSMEYLRNYSNANTGPDDKLGESEKDNDETVKSFLEYLVGHQYISYFSKAFAQLSLNCQNQMIKFLYNVSIARLLRVEVVKQGGLNLILYYLIKDENEWKSTANESYTNFNRIFALRSLAKVLISNNPSLIFSKYDPIVAVPPLVEVLIEESAATSGIEKFVSRLVKPLDVLESLLALTNIASVNDLILKEKIIVKAWPYLEPLILDSNASIQNASLQLISNVIICPIGASKFFNSENPESRGRLDVLIKLLDSVDENIQISALTIFVNAAEHSLIAGELANNQPLFVKLLSIIINQHENEELVLRVVYLVMLIFQVSSKEVIAKVKNYGSGEFTLENGLVELLDNENQEVEEIVREVLKMGE